VDFLLVLIYVFLLGVTAEALQVNIDWKSAISLQRPRGAGWSKISGRMRRPTNHSSSQKTRLNDLSYGIKIWTDLFSVLSQCTGLTDRQTEEQNGQIGGRTDLLIARPRLHCMQRGKNCEIPLRTRAIPGAPRVFMTRRYKSTFTLPYFTSRSPILVPIKSSYYICDFVW